MASSIVPYSDPGFIDRRLLSGIQALSLPGRYGGFND